MEMVEVNFKKIEKKWQKRWEKEKVFLVKVREGEVTSLILK